MSTDLRGAKTGPARSVRRRRGAEESLASIVLGSETIVVFLGGLTIFGLRALPEGIPQWWGIVAGTVLAVAMFATIPFLRHRWGITLGWVWQLVVVLGALILPALALVGLIFGAMFAFATLKGSALDKMNAARLSAAQNGE